MRSAPAVISPTPATSFQLKGSPRTSTANVTDTARLSLSIGSTCDAGPAWSALKYASHDPVVAAPASARTPSDFHDTRLHALCSPCHTTSAQVAASTIVVRHAEASVGAMLDQVETQLAHGRDWYLGERYSALDPFALVLCRWTRNFARPARSLPRLGSYLERMLARPAVRKAIASEKLPPPYV